ncbi:MAG: metal ABC transporter permease [Firmicutes bacterium]|nr:metal ABC transporter permease [Bacillota bacterium]
MVESILGFLKYEFIQNAAFAGLLASIAAGVVGSYVVIKRITLISGGIAHTVLGGMGIAYYLGKEPLAGAIVAAIFSAFLLGLVNLKAKQHEDTIIGALWAVGMALGVIFMALTPGYNVDLMSFLFGNILMVTHPILRLLFYLDTAILLVVAIFYRQFKLICFDEELARLQGLHVEALYVLLLCLIALTVVILIKVVGLILVIALLTLPAAVAGLFTHSLGRMMGLAAALSLFFTWSGLVISYNLNLPAGAVMVITAGVSYLAALSWKRLDQKSRREESSF